MPDRADWFFGVDMGVYHTTGQNPRTPIVPDVFLSLGVERRKYVVYNPDYAARDKQDPLEVYRLVEGDYIRQIDEPLRMPEIGLGIGRGQGSHEGWEREWLYWYDQAGNRLPTPEERANQAEQELESLVAKLREKGINPEML
jgi:hypothetical protein